jgi:energy-coupling factor transporter transmembrane protein EcfT
VSNKRSSGGSAGGVIFFVLVLIFVVSKVPKPVWIMLGIIAAIAVLFGFVAWIVTEETKRRAAAAERARIEGEAKAAAAKRDRETRARKEKQRRIDTLGIENAAIVESVLKAVREVGASEAARAGWLGDVDFSADVKGITDHFEKAYALYGVTNSLSALDKPSNDDRRILAEGRTTFANLERVAIERAELIFKCAKEAKLIDKSLRSEREDARVAEQRAELHAKLSGMLYGIEATPNTAPTDSAVDAVMARVQAYREIKDQIQLARGIGFQ